MTNYFFEVQLVKQLENLTRTKKDVSSILTERLFLIFPVLIAGEWWSEWIVLKETVGNFITYKMMT